MEATTPAAPPPEVDFRYAFAPPHRLTVARPDSPDKTLVDVWPDRIRLSWSFEDLGRFHPMSYALPLVAWEYDLFLFVDDAPVPATSWRRRGEWLPHAQVGFVADGLAVNVELVGTEIALAGRVEIRNDSTTRHGVRLAVVKRPPPDPARAAEWADAIVPTAVVGRGHPGGYNVAWAHPDAAADVLVAGFGDRADRLILVGLGADRYERRGPAELHLRWDVAPGATRAGWLVRPYRSLVVDIDHLRQADWAAAVETAEREWRDLLAPAMRPVIPDATVATAFLACLADIFVMRETLPDGTVVTTPGTEVYRAPNTGEAAFATIALDQAGLHERAAAGFELPISNQAPDGNWADPTGWMHTMWCCSGFKGWAVMTHYRLTHDRAYLERIFPRMLASARWQEAQRAATRHDSGPDGMLTYGLMPRGMGDCGLREGDDLWGFFLPHNVWSVYGDRLAEAVAVELGRDAEAVELHAIVSRALADLRASLDRGAIPAATGRWIPGSPGRTSGSRWGALNAANPCRVLEPDHELVTGTLEYIRRHLSSGGIPLNMGWMQNGMWVAIALDNVAEVLLDRDEGAEATALLYAVLNHGTPFFTWCEERGPEPGSSNVSGDRQHLYTPVSVVRYVRDALAMERPDGVHLGLGVPAAWIASGQPVGILDAPTTYGRIGWEVRCGAFGEYVEGWVEARPWTESMPVVLHIAAPEGYRIGEVTAEGGAEADLSRGTVVWHALASRATVRASLVRSTPPPGMEALP